MKKILLSFLLSVVMLCICHITLYASELTLYQMTENTDVKEKADLDAKTLISLKAGTLVVFVEEKVGWVEIRYQEYTGYVPVMSLTEYVSPSGIDEEFDEIEETFDNIYEEIKSLRRKKAQGVLWGIIIIAFVVMIIVMGVMKLLNRNKKSRES